MDLKFINSIIFPEWVEQYDEEIISSIKHAAQTHGRYLEKYSDLNFVLHRSVEISKSTRYQNLNQTQKLIFISNAVFDNDEEFIQKMRAYGWTKEKSKNLNTLIIKIKILQRKNCEITLDTSLIEEIKLISTKCFGIKNPAALINRLNELSATKKEEINYTKKY